MRTLKLQPYPGLDAVASEILRLIRSESVRPGTRTLAVRLAVEGGIRTNDAGHPDLRDNEALARAVYAAVVRRVNYARDPFRTELVQSPRETVNRGIGDCEDMVVLGGAVLASLGVPVRVVVVGYGPAGYDHTYLEYDAGRGWRAWDATLASSVGAVAPGARRRRHFALSGGARFGLAGTPPTRDSRATRATRTSPAVRLDPAKTGTAIDRGGTTTASGSGRPWWETRGYSAAEVAAYAIGAHKPGGGQYAEYRHGGTTYPLPVPRSATLNLALLQAVETGRPVAYGGSTWSWAGERLHLDGAPYGKAGGAASDDTVTYPCQVPPCPEGPAHPGDPDPDDSEGDDGPKTVLGLPVPVLAGGAAVAAFLLLSK